MYVLLYSHVVKMSSRTKDGTSASHRCSKSLNGREKAQTAALTLIRHRRHYAAFYLCMTGSAGFQLHSI